MLRDIFSPSLLIEHPFRELYQDPHEARLPDLCPPRIGVGRSLNNSRPYPGAPPDSSSDTAFKSATSLDHSGNSLAAHFTFRRLRHLQFLKNKRQAKDGCDSQCQIGAACRRRAASRASNRCLITPRSVLIVPFHSVALYGDRRQGDKSLNQF
jgi:hypothetical protein